MDILGSILATLLGKFMSANGHGIIALTGLIAMVKLHFFTSGSWFHSKSSATINGDIFHEVCKDLTKWWDSEIHLVVSSELWKSVDMLSPDVKPWSDNLHIRCYGLESRNTYYVKQADKHIWYREGQIFSEMAFLKFSTD